MLTLLLMLILFALTVRTIRSGLSKWASESKVDSLMLPSGLYFATML